MKVDILFALHLDKFISHGILQVSNAGLDILLQRLYCIFNICKIEPNNELPRKWAWFPAMDRKRRHEDGAELKRKKEAIIAYNIDQFSRSENVGSKWPIFMEIYLEHAVNIQPVEDEDYTSFSSLASFLVFNPFDASKFARICVLRKYSSDSVSQFTFYISLEYATDLPQFTTFTANMTTLNPNARWLRINLEDQRLLYFNEGNFNYQLSQQLQDHLQIAGWVGRNQKTPLKVAFKPSELFAKGSFTESGMVCIPD